MVILKKTHSVCDVCLKKVPAHTFQEKGKVFIKKNCPKHGIFVSRHFWDDPNVYREFLKIKTCEANTTRLSIPITYRCNLNCPVCFVNANDIKAQEFNIKDFKKIKKFADYQSFYLTGGEPTVREDLPEIIRMLNRKNRSVTVFTNGIKLGDFDYAKILKLAGLRSVILQFDSLTDSHNEYIHGRKLLEIKKRAIINLQKLGIKIILCTIVIKNKNIEQLGKLLNFAFQWHAVKTVNLNLLRKMGRYKQKDFISSSQIVEEICRVTKTDRYDWLQSTRFSCNIDRLQSLILKRGRIYSKCYLTNWIIYSRGEYIPISKIFNLKKINRKIEVLNQKKSLMRILIFGINLFFVDFLANYFNNKYMRIFIANLFSNVKFLFRGERQFFNPFRYLSVGVYPSEKNVDYDFIDGCNYIAFSPKYKYFMPACIDRIRTLKNYQ